MLNRLFKQVSLFAVQHEFIQMCCFKIQILEISLGSGVFAKTKNSKKMVKSLLDNFQLQQIRDFKPFKAYIESVILSFFFVGIF